MRVRRISDQPLLEGCEIEAVIVPFPQVGVTLLMQPKGRVVRCPRECIDGPEMEQRRREVY